MRCEGEGRGRPRAVAIWALFGCAASPVACAMAVDAVQSVDGAGTATSGNGQGRDPG